MRRNGFIIKILLAYQGGKGHGVAHTRRRTAVYETCASRSREGQERQYDYRGNLRIIKDLFPDVFSILTRIGPEEAFGIFERYKDQQFFAREVAVLLSPKGKELVAKELQMIREYAEKNRPANQEK